MYQTGKTEPKIIQNVLPKMVFEQLQREIVDSALPWYYTKTTAYSDADEKLWHGSWVHMVLDDGKINSPLGLMLQTVALSALSAANENVKSIHRIRIGLITTAPGLTVHDPHVDFEFEHRTALLYLTESDGYTTLYDKYFDRNVNQKNVLYTMPIQNLIDPEPNKLVVFDGLQYHSSSAPTEYTRRIVININYFGGSNE